MGKYRLFDPCADGEHDDCAADLGIEGRCSCDCHVIEGEESLDEQFDHAEASNR
jgi:hypothetical protein